MHKIKFYGLGGQGVVTAAKILCHAVSIHENKFAKNFPAYGHERRGAPVLADVLIDNKTIFLNSFVYTPEFVIVFDPYITDKGIDIGTGIHENTVLVINSDNDKNIQKLQGELNFKEIYFVNATKIALKQTGKNVLNGAMLGAFAKTGIVKIESITKSLHEFFKNEVGVKNAKSAEEAYRHVRRI